MTPVPKGLNKKQTLVWRRNIRKGVGALRSAKRASSGRWGYHRP